ncbi:hypothetical protein WR25_26331 [Diploscapter pachys]|uniref:C2H2-type domain-containing protein n=1 Tax=Diploscapter pachys TaxID=2018661 RepID=A0A2A2L6B9_9BILA|nr:hypothetical protein WR25_26331 [Diploscapter pachys]
MFACSSCELRESSIENLEAHICLEHLDFHPWLCDLCPTTRCTRKQMKKHYWAKHGQRDPKMNFACNEVKEIELARMLWEAQKSALLNGLDYGISNRNLNIGELPESGKKKANLFNGIPDIPEDGENSDLINDSRNASSSRGTSSPEIILESVQQKGKNRVINSVKPSTSKQPPPPNTVRYNVRSTTLPVANSGLTKVFKKTVMQVNRPLPNGVTDVSTVRYVCKRCHDSVAHTQLKYHCLKHIHKDYNLAPFYCSGCPSVFHFRESVISQHIGTFHLKDPIFRVVENFTKEIIDKIEEQMAACFDDVEAQVKRQGLKKKNLSTKKNVDQNKLYCKLCTKTIPFPSKDDVLLHVGIHMRDVCAQFRYFCWNCDHKSAQEYVIKQHCKATHGNTNEYDDHIESWKLINLRKVSQLCFKDQNYVVNMMPVSWLRRWAIPIPCARPTPKDNVSLVSKRTRSNANQVRAKKARKEAGPVENKNESEEKDQDSYGDEPTPSLGSKDLFRNKVEKEENLT